MSRKIKLFILGSILLNVLLAGAIVGILLHGIDRNIMSVQTEDALNHLSVEKRGEFLQAMDTFKRQNADNREEMKKIREDMVHILVVEHFDEIAYQKETDKLYELRGKQKQLLADTVKKLARRWSQQDRAYLAEILRYPMYTPDVKQAHSKFDDSTPQP